MRPKLLEVRWDQGESLMARLASLTVRWRGFMRAFTSGLRSLWSLPCWVYAAASSPHACHISSASCFEKGEGKNGTLMKPMHCCQNSGWPRV